MDHILLTESGMTCQLNEKDRCKYKTTDGTSRMGNASRVKTLFNFS